MEPAFAAESEPYDDHDHVVVLHAVPWSLYESLLDARGDSSVPRITFLDGELELMTPAWNHEEWKTRLARLFEAWCDERGIDVVGVGSWTLRKKRKRAGAEPDECYVVRPDGRLPVEVPDIAVEVVHTHRLGSKLEVYRRLGVREVWIRAAGELAVHLLREDGYERAGRSEVLPELDPAVLVPFMTSADNQGAAVRAFRATLRRG